MNKRRFLGAAATVLAGSLGHAAHAQAQASPRIRYGGDAAFAPFESLDAGGQPQGFQIELLAELATVTPLRFEVSLQPWKRTEADFRAGQLDLIAMVDTTQRRAWARFTRGHATPAMALYHLPGRAAVQSLKDLAGLRLAVLDSDPSRETLATWLASLPGPFVRVPDAAQALSAVVQGQADVALLPRAYADPLIAAGQAGGLVASHLNLALQSYAFAMAPGNDALQTTLQQGLDTLEASGRLEALRVKWLSSHRDVAERNLLERGLTMQREWTLGLAAASATALALMGVGIRRRGRRIAAEQQARRQAEAALQRAQEMLERTFAHHPDAMLVLERGSGIVRDANAALLALLGTTADGVLGQPLAALSRHVDAPALQPLVESLAADGVLDAVPLPVRRADGTRRDCLVSAELLRVDDAPHVFCIVRDITEQLAQDAALRAAYDTMAAKAAQAAREAEAARAGQARAEGALHDFTRAVVHDLKSPLNALQGFAGLLRQRLVAGHVQEALGYTEHIDRAARRMTAMVNALAGLAQVAKVPLQRRPVDMERLARDTWSIVCAAHPARRAEFRIDPLPKADAAPDLAAQIWQNLLDNASKYSAKVDAAKIAVTSFRDTRGTWYRVADNGAGFDMDKAQALFQPFQRMHGSQQFEGTGIGLSLVRRIVDHHGGEIRVRSAPGVGTVAEFTLDPAADAPPG